MKNHYAAMVMYAAAALLAATGPAHAQLYHIDTDFANSGRYNQTFPGADFRLLAHLARPDGTSVAIVTYDNNLGCPAGRHCLALYPFNVAGQVQPPVQVPSTHSFSKRAGGIVIDPNLVKAAAIDSQNRIVIVGTEQFGAAFQFKVIRLLPNGQPDTSFDGDGIAQPGNFSSQFDDVAEAVSIDAVDRIVLAGSVRFSATDTDFAVLRLTTSGALDSAFGVNGRRVISYDLGGPRIDRATAVVHRLGGQIYLAGVAMDGSTARIGLARLLPDGSLDGSFCPTTCNFQGPYTGVHSGRRVLFYGQAADNLSDFVSSLAVHASGEMVYAGMHQTVVGGGFRIFTQKVALNGNYAAEALTNTGLGGALQYSVGGIRYFNPNSASNLVLTGSVGPDREFFFAQGLSGNLSPVPNWGGNSSSTLLYTASGSFGDNPSDLPAIPSVDASGRVLLGGSYKATSSDPNYSINVMRLVELIFRNGFE